MPIWPLVILVMAYALVHRGHDTLDCYDACQEPQARGGLVVEPVDHDAIFGPQRPVNVTAGKPRG